MDILDEFIEKLENPEVHHITFQNLELETWLKELKYLRVMVRQQSAVIVSQARYIEQYIDRR